MIVRSWGGLDLHLMKSTDLQELQELMENGHSKPDA